MPPTENEYRQDIKNKLNDKDLENQSSPFFQGGARGGTLQRA